MITTKHLLGILVYMCGACVHVCVVSVCVVCEKAKEPERERKWKSEEERKSWEGGRERKKRKELCIKLLPLYKHMQYTHAMRSHFTKKWTLPRGILDVTKHIFSSKTHFPENWKSWRKALWELAKWVWFRIPQNIPSVRARWLVKTASILLSNKTPLALVPFRDFVGLMVQPATTKHLDSACWR